MCFDICTINIRMSIRVRVLHLVFSWSILSDKHLHPHPISQVVLLIFVHEKLPALSQQKNHTPAQASGTETDCSPNFGDHPNMFLMFFGSENRAPPKKVTGESPCSHSFLDVHNLRC